MKTITITPNMFYDRTADELKKIDQFINDSFECVRKLPIGYECESSASLTDDLLKIKRMNSFFNIPSTDVNVSYQNDFLDLHYNYRVTMFDIITI